MWKIDKEWQTVKFKQAYYRKKYFDKIMFQYNRSRDKENEPNHWKRQRQPTANTPKQKAETRIIKAIKIYETNWTTVTFERNTARIRPQRKTLTRYRRRNQRKANQYWMNEEHIMWTLCGKENETVSHVRSRCKELEKTKKIEKQLLNEKEDGLKTGFEGLQLGEIKQVYESSLDYIQCIEKYTNIVWSKLSQKKQLSNNI